MHVVGSQIEFVFESVRGGGGVAGAWLRLCGCGNVERTPKGRGRGSAEVARESLALPRVFERVGLQSEGCAPGRGGGKGSLAESQPASRRHGLHRAPARLRICASMPRARAARAVRCRGSQRRGRGGAERGGALRCPRRFGVQGGCARRHRAAGQGPLPRRLLQGAPGRVRPRRGLARPAHPSRQPRARRWCQTCWPATPTGVL